MTTQSHRASRGAADRTAAKLIAIIILTLTACCVFWIQFLTGKSAAGDAGARTPTPPASAPSVPAYAPSEPTRNGGRSPDWLDIRSFGARGDGKTDDTGAIQAALSSGKRIYFPAGTYVVDQLYIEDASDVVLSGYGATLLKKTGSGAWSKILDIVSADNVQVLGLTFDGNKPNVAADKGCGSICGTGLTNFLFKDLKIRNAFYGTVVLSDCHYGAITNCSFDDTDVGILGMDRANSHLDIDGCVFSGGTSEGVSFGIYTDMTPAYFSNVGYHDDIRIANCRFLNKDANCIQLRNARNVYVTGNYFERTDPAKNTAGITIDPDGAAGLDIVPDTIVLQSNYFKGLRFDGVLVTKGTNIVIKDNYFDGIQTYNIVANGGTITGNTFANIKSGVQAVIFAGGRNIKIIKNIFIVDSAKIPCVIGLLANTAGIMIVDNILIKDSANTCVDIDIEYGSVLSDYTILNNIGFNNINPSITLSPE